MTRARTRGLVIVAALAVALLAGVPTLGLLGSAVAPSLTVVGSTQPTGPVVVAPAFIPGPGVRAVGPLGANLPLDVAVSLASPDPSGLQGQLALEYSAGSPERGQFLTAAQVAARFAPSSASYEAAVRYFEAAGASVVPSPDHWMLLVQGPSSILAAAFHTEFEEYDAGGRVFFSHPTPSTLPPVAPWSGVLGLGNETPVVPFDSVAAAGSASAGCTGAQPFAPCAIASAYNVSGLYSTGKNGSGVRVGVVDPYDGQEKQSTLSSDLSTFASMFGLSKGNVSFLYPVPTKRNLNSTSTGWATEEALDLEWTRASAPGATLDMTFAPDASAGLYFSVDWLVANQVVNVISLSWGEPDVGAFNPYSTPCSAGCNATSDGSYAILHPVLEAAALEGIGVFAASGDCGAAMGTAGDSTSYPASDPDATGVGATDLTLKGVQWAGEVAWSGNSTGATSPGCQNQGGSGGGFSPFPRPFWQAAPGVPAAPAVRGVPDVSVDGGNPVTIIQSGFTTGVVGTSVATPIWAGYAAIADQIHGGPLGLLNPSLYALARGPTAGQYFHDVRSGSNGYSAGPGWDPVTGIGTPNASALLIALATGLGLGPSAAPSLEASGRIGPAPLGVRFTASVPSGTAPVAGYDVDYGDGNASWSTNGSLAHTYTTAAAYDARAVVFYIDGNSSASPPVLVLVGTGAALSVALSLNVTSVPVGAPVTFNASVSGGTAPYLYAFDFGDGSYYRNSTVPSWTHAYGFAGAFCAVVTVTDAATPSDGGASLEVPVSVGGAGPPSCAEQTPLSVSLPAEPAAMDLPANVNLSASTFGAAGPVAVQVVSDDPYVTECQCGIFRIPGNHTIRLFANDSVSQEASTWLNITAFPALTGAFYAQLPGAPVSGASPIGAAPLTVDFGVTASGGNGTTSSATWTFGDGSAPAIGAAVVHTYASPGYYVAGSVVHDGSNGTAAHAFLIDVLTNATPAPVGLSAEVGLGPGAAAGNVVAFDASTNFGSTGVLYDWQLGDNDSSFGYDPTQSYTTGCLAADRCPLSITVNASDTLGEIANVTFSLPFPFFGRSSALALTDQVTGGGGSTPYVLGASAATSRMPGAKVGWSFGDGNGSTGLTASHTYFSPGAYTLVDTGQDSIGDVQVRSHTVRVSGPPIAPLVFTGGPGVLSGVVPFPVAFHANASGGYGAPYTYDWQFGDGLEATGPWANHTYSLRGNYTATLTATDDRGTTNTTRWELQAFNATSVLVLLMISPAIVSSGDSFSVYATPIANCSTASVTGCSNENVTLTEQSSAVLVSTGLFYGEPYVFQAPSTPGEFPIWVNATGFYRGSAEGIVQVTSPSGPAWTPLDLVVVGGIVGGVVAATVIVVALRGRRRPPPITP